MEVIYGKEKKNEEKKTKQKNKTKKTNEMENQTEDSVRRREYNIRPLPKP